jgi:hypothetical protein
MLLIFDPAILSHDSPRRDRANQNRSGARQLADGRTLFVLSSQDVLFGARAARRLAARIDDTVVKAALPRR